MVGAVLVEGSAPLSRSASAVATEVIREAIIAGRLEPGRRLKEEELARELGMSRTPVREALLSLQS
ncbi:MAG TPA: GntR family transcriptional regulator, partial [Gaiellaceae bacterium]|nr:GntR family transcriptional regulator [Gaiellaceae bacterium]